MNERGEISFETRQAMFLQETNEIEQKYGSLELLAFLQNLPQYFPGKKQGGFLRKTAEYLGQLDFTPKDSDSNIKLMSDLRANQTYREFFQQVDAAVAKLGLTDEIGVQTDTLTKTSRNANTAKDWEIMREIQLQMLPNLKRVYSVLRANGYDMYDITGHTMEQFLVTQKAKKDGTTEQGN